ncbi:MAG: cyanophycin synthetase [Sphingobacteriales bacterium]|jgi:cyanophycin synthetase
MPLPLLDYSRRLTGPNFFWDLPGSILDVIISEKDYQRFIPFWEQSTRSLLNEVGWENERTIHRKFTGGASLVMSGPRDGLYAACELHEAAFEMALIAFEGRQLPHPEEYLPAIKSAIAEEKNNALLEMRDWASERKISFLMDDDRSSVGIGKGSVVFDNDKIPSTSTFEEDKIFDVPRVLITGTNGKSTTVRTLFSIIKESGLTPGLTSTDFIKVGDEILDYGDYSGPEGARTISRNTKVDFAILEVARGGILRRGLPVLSAGAAVVTNIAEDHFGEYGINTLDEMTIAKLVVARTLDETGILVLNADDNMLVKHSKNLECNILWTSLDPQNPLIQGKDRCTLEEGKIVHYWKGTRTEIIEAATIPLTMGGLAKHNIHNALSAVSLAMHFNINPETINKALSTFGASPEDNPGRSLFFEKSGRKILIDFAHNVAGFNALKDTILPMNADRRLLLFGQAGDRSNEEIKALTIAALGMQPTHIVLADMKKYLRGREMGEVPGIIKSTLMDNGFPEKEIQIVNGIPAGGEISLSWSKPGDLLIFLALTEREELMEVVNRT